MLHTIFQIAARHKSVLVTVTLVVAVGWAAVSGTRGVQDWMAKRDEIRRLQEENAALEQENLKRKERVERLESSPSEQDIEIRKLNLTKPGETVFMLPEEEKQRAKPKRKQR